MVYSTVFNTTDQPIVVDAEGRAVGGREWGTVETLAEQAAAALSARHLVVIEKIAKNADPRALAAAARTAEVSDRAGRLQGMEKDELTALALDAGVPGAEQASKPDLVALLAARTNVAVPERASTRSAKE